MVLITAAAGLYLGDLRSGVSPFHLQAFLSLLGIALVTCGSSALNQALERRSDARMHRTANRPMVTGRIGLAHGLLLGFGTIVAGTILLARETNVLTTTLTLLTATGYVAIYTPLKRITSLNTFIGAFPGALPPLIGWTAARGLIEWPAIALFSVLFVWQFPHFMAIGWLYRDEYRHGGIRLAATQQPITWAARSTVWQALFYAVLMIPAALWTTFLGVNGAVYAIIATLLSLGYLWYTIRFAAILRDPEAVRPNLPPATCSKLPSSTCRCFSPPCCSPPAAASPSSNIAVILNEVKHLCISSSHCRLPHGKLPFRLEPSHASYDQPRSPRLPHPAQRHRDASSASASSPPHFSFGWSTSISPWTSPEPISLSSPHLNALLNLCCTVALLYGFRYIWRSQVIQHRNSMFVGLYLLIALPRLLHHELRITRRLHFSAHPSCSRVLFTFTSFSFRISSPPPSRSR